jgi:hypothetical protein
MCHVYGRRCRWALIGPSPPLLGCTAFASVIGSYRPRLRHWVVLPSLGCTSLTSIVRLYCLCLRHWVILPSPPSLGHTALASIIGLQPLSLGCSLRHWVTSVVAFTTLSPHSPRKGREGCGPAVIVESASLLPNLSPHLQTRLPVLEPSVVVKSINERTSLKEGRHSCVERVGRREDHPTLPGWQRGCILG